MDKVNAECDSDWASRKPQPWRGMPAPGVGLQALTSPVCAFSGLHDAPASPGADSTGFASGRISKWTDATEVAARPMMQTFTPQHTWARHGACGRPQPGREFQACLSGFPLPAGEQKHVQKRNSRSNTPGTVHYP